MARCHDRYLGTQAWAGGGERLVVDVGGADVNGGYRPIFDDPRYRSLLEIETSTPCTAAGTPCPTS